MASCIFPCIMVSLASVACTRIHSSLSSCRSGLEVLGVVMEHVVSMAITYYRGFIKYSTLHRLKHCVLSKMQRNVWSAKQPMCFHARWFHFCDKQMSPDTAILINQISCTKLNMKECASIACLVCFPHSIYIYVYTLILPKDIIYSRQLQMQFFPSETATQPHYSGPCNMLYFICKQLYTHINQRA